MTQKGEPHRGLSLAYGASFFGGMFSVIVLMLFSPKRAVAPHRPLHGGTPPHLRAHRATELDE